jgi:hypothetical protein
MNKNLLVLTLLCFACAQKDPALNSIVLRKKYDVASQVDAAYPHKVKKKAEIVGNSLLLSSSGKTISISRANIPPNLNTFIFSDDGKHFVAFEETEVDTDELYFYQSDGTLLAKQTVDIYPEVDFSNNGQYVSVFNQFGREVMLYTNQGTMVYHGDYTDMVKGPSQPIYHVIASDSGDALLLNVGTNAYVFNVKADSIQSHATVGRVLDGSFYSNDEAVAILVAPDTTHNRSLIIMSRNAGQIVDKICPISHATFITNGFVLFTESAISEYRFQ